MQIILPLQKRTVLLMEILNIVDGGTHNKVFEIRKCGNRLREITARCLRVNYYTFAHLVVGGVTLHHFPDKASKKEQMLYALYQSTRQRA